MMKFFLVIMVMSGCAKQMLKQSPPLANHETFYVIEKEVNKVSHNRCKKLNGKNRKCTKTYFKTDDLWDIFHPGFIIIHKSKVFR